MTHALLLRQGKITAQEYRQLEALKNGTRADQAEYRRREARYRKRKRSAKLSAFIARKVDYLIHREGYDPMQAVAVAYSLARRKYGNHSLKRR